MNGEHHGITRRELLFVDGSPLESGAAGTLKVINPSNGQQCSSIPAGCGEDVDHAVASGRREFESGSWSDAPPSLRKKVLHRFADLILKEALSLDALDAEEMGKPVSEPRSNGAGAAELMRFCAEAVDKLTGDVYLSDKDSFVAQRRIPRGVVAAVTPWNFPTHNAVRKLGPALAAGNCVVLKPSELSSRSALRLAHLGIQAGLPPGVLNVVLGSGHVVGRALALHPDVDMLTFTGSTANGKLMVQCAGQSNLKVVIAECGGKSPHIVFNDGIDLASVARSIARSLLSNQGQICSVGSRLLVERSAERSILEMIAAEMTRIVMGDALEPKTTFGPLASATQLHRVLEHIKSAQEDGAELISGGQQALRESGGFFVQPTLFRNVAPTARIAQEEVFGPVLAVTTFEREEEAICVANGTPYGLAAYLWTAHLSRALRIGKSIRSSVWINSGAPRGEGAGYSSSLEPVGQSGVGVEGGVAGLESYMRRQTVSINHA